MMTREGGQRRESDGLRIRYSPRRAGAQGGDTTKETTCSGDWASLKGTRLRRTVAARGSQRGKRLGGQTSRLEFAPLDCVPVGTVHIFPY